MYSTLCLTINQLNGNCVRLWLWLDRGAFDRVGAKVRTNLITDKMFGALKLAVGDTI